MTPLDSSLMLIPTGLQMIGWFFVAHLVGRFPNLTYRPWFLGPYADIGHKVCRAIASAAYVAALFGAAVSFFGVLIEEPETNHYGILVSRWAGPIIVFHLIGMMAKKVLREKTRG